MSTLPTGTVTYLFADIEGSVALWERDPVAMREVMRLHDETVERCVRQNAGHVVRPRGEGDSRFAVFARPTDAVAAACALQRALHTEPWATPMPIRMRVALHTGEGELRAGDYYGSAVNRCARVRAIAHGGQILLTVATAELVRDALPLGVKLRPLGVHRLKDLQRSEEIFQLLHRDLPEEFPPLQSLDVWPNNLPVQLTSFVGREKEIAEVKKALASARLLTLTGAGGCGKTRLALQVAAEVQDGYADGVWLVELGALTDLALVPQTLAATLGVRENPHRTMNDTLVEFLRPKQLLLIIDNCEHLLEPCAQVADTLLRACSNVRVLATSRETLGVAGEVAFRVPSLALPDPRQPSSAENLAQYEAVRLFRERAGAVVLGFKITNENAPIVGHLCHRLDGIPLAIELAAARLKALSLEHLAQRLDDRFRLLTGGSRTALPRHQTLRATMDWSYQLLSEKEQILFRSLSTFAGGFSLEAAEAVCAYGKLGSDEFLEFFTELVDKSLVVYDRQDDQGRYRLLETVRQYGKEKLVTLEEETVRRQHLEFFLAIAKRGELELKGVAQKVWLATLEAEHDNLRAALDWVLRHGEPDVVLRLAGALWWFWLVRGHRSEGRNWLERALSNSREMSTPERAKVLYGAGFLAWLQDDLRRAAILFEECLSLSRALTNRSGLAYSLLGLGAVAQARGDLARAIELDEESLALFLEEGDKWATALVLLFLGAATRDKSEHDRARGLWEESLRLARELQDIHGIAVVLRPLGGVALRQGDDERAKALLAESLALAEDLGDKEIIAGAVRLLGRISLRHADYAQAATLLEKSLILTQELGDKNNLALSLEWLADVACTMGHCERATRLCAAAQALREAIGTPMPPADHADFGRIVNAARERLGEKVFATGWEKGRAMTLEQAVAYALERPASS